MTDHELQIWLKTLEYKRGIGATQWTVLGVFLTASEATFIFGLTQSDGGCRAFMLVLAFSLYWLGYSLFKRYRELNRAVSRYLMKLEGDSGGLQTDLNKFHETGLTTKTLLFSSGLIYTVLCLAAIFWHLPVRKP